MSKERVINIRPHGAQIRRYEGGFEWTFYALKIRGKGFIKLRMKFERWWLVYLSTDLFNVLAEEEKEVKRIRELMTQGGSD